MSTMEEEIEEWNGIMNPQMKLCWDYYANPKSQTFNSARASAKKAGYSDSYANTITAVAWWKSKARKLGLLGKAEKALNKALEMDVEDSNGKVMADVARVQTDVAKFIAKTLGKDEGYSERTELTGKGGEGIVFMPVELMDKYNLNKKMETEQNQEEVQGIVVPVDPQDANICEGCE